MYIVAIFQAVLFFKLAVFTNFPERNVGITLRGDIAIVFKSFPCIYRHLFISKRVNLYKAIFQIVSSLHNPVIESCPDCACPVLFSVFLTNILCFASNNDLNIRLKFINSDIEASLKSLIFLRNIPEKKIFIIV